jgi:hypothetical protein
MLKMVMALTLAVVSFASIPAGLAAPGVSTQNRSRDEGAFLTFEVFNPGVSCLRADGSTLVTDELAYVFLNQSNAMLSYDLSSAAPGVFASFGYSNDCVSGVPLSGSGVTDPTAYGDPAWAAPYISFSGKVDDKVGPDGRLRWARIDEARFPIFLDSHDCYLQAVLTMDASAVGPLQRFPVSNYSDGTHFSRIHYQVEQRVAAASGTLTLTPIDPWCPVPPNPSRFVASAVSYYPWGDPASILYRAQSTQVTVAP